MTTVDGPTFAGVARAMLSCAVRALLVMAFVGAACTGQGGAGGATGAEPREPSPGVAGTDEAATQPAASSDDEPAGAEPDGTRRAQPPRPDEGSPPPMPARIEVHVHLPGAAANRHLQVTLDGWTLRGCIGPPRIDCAAPRTIDVSSDARVELIGLWAETHSGIRCEPDSIYPGDRRFQLRYLDLTIDGLLPASEADLPDRNAGACRVHARMAMWFVRQLEMP